ncbi:MAG: hypothetical protein IJ233_03805, partial [Pyramidobacter sp.]|nr:hypothetical protein [Pyramidobacter sp.]
TAVERIRKNLCSTACVADSNQNNSFPAACPFTASLQNSAGPFIQKNVSSGLRINNPHRLHVHSSVHIIQSRKPSGVSAAH